MPCISVAWPVGLEWVLQRLAFWGSQMKAGILTYYCLYSLMGPKERWHHNSEFVCAKIWSDLFVELKALHHGPLQSPQLLLRNLFSHQRASTDVDPTMSAECLIKCSKHEEKWVCCFHMSFSLLSNHSSVFLCLKRVHDFG